MYFESLSASKHQLYLIASENLTMDLASISLENGTSEEELASDVAGSCKGTAGTLGSLGCATGCAGTFGTAGTYGCGS